jgi:hypothetical protein
VGKRQRKRKRERPVASAATSDYSDPEGNILTLRDDLTEGTVRQLDQLDSKPAATAEDRWQRRVEFLFERLAVRWEIAGLPIESQKELLARYRMASFEERRAVRDLLAEHLRGRLPGVEL